VGTRLPRIREDTSTGWTQERFEDVLVAYRQILESQDLADNRLDLVFDDEDRVLNLSKKSIPLHPILFAIYPVLFLYGRNVDFATLRDALVPMTIMATAASLLLAVLYAILRDPTRAGLLVSSLALLFFSYGHLVDLLEGFQIPIGQFTIGPDAVLLPIWVLCLSLGIKALLKTTRDLRNVTNLLNVVAAVLVLISLGGIVSYHLGRARMADAEGEEPTKSRIFSADYVEGLPDVYYIILDAYSSQDVLEEVWDYDNSEFVEYLTEAGFYVIPDAHSNYAITFLSLASSLNMQYMNNLSQMLGTDSTDRSIPNEMIQNSEAMRFLKGMGYKFVHFQTGWGPTAANPHADRDVRCGSVNEFTEVLVRTTVLRPLADRLISHDRREVVLCTFATLAEVQHTTEAPRFVFAHILVPHPPFLFGAEGEAIQTEAGLQTKDWSKYYLGQLEFVSGQVEQLVDRILSEAEIEPIIVLQADHGSKSMRKSDEPSPEMLKERFGILNAYHLPDGGERFLYDSITPVNTFRVLLNGYFGADYQPLEDRSYFSRLKQPYDFLDATETLATN
jgi:hypothetical protein